VHKCTTAPRPPTPELWSQEEEDLLLAISSDNTDIKDLTLGVTVKQVATAV